MPARESGEGFWSAFKRAFAVPAESSLTDQEREWLEKIARKVVERGLAVPAVFMLETARPLNYVGSQVLVFFKPIISFVFPAQRCDEVAALLEKRGSLEALAQMIQQHDACEKAPHTHEPSEQ